MKPYLFIDVDGVLNPDVVSPQHSTFSILGYKVHLNPDHGQQLVNLAEYYELTWATTWQDLANIHIGPKIGLPELPFITWSDRSPTQRDYRDHVMLKTKDIVKYSGDRPWAWIDDDIRFKDLAYLTDHVPLDTYLCMRINSRWGLTTTDCEKLREFGQKWSE